MKNRSFPTSHTILILIAAIACLLTWVIPAGQYNSLVYNDAKSIFIVSDAQNNEKIYPASDSSLAALGVKIPLEKFTSGSIYKPIAVPNTYQNIEAKPQGIAAFMQSPIKGIINAADIIFLVLIIGGLIGIMNLTGAFNAGIAWLSKALEGKEFLLIILVTAICALGGTTFGFQEEGIAFIPILVPVFLAARYDALVAVACIFLGSAIGTMSSTTNPFATIIASDAAGINWLTGLNMRMLMFVVTVGTTILYILHYAKKVKANPTYSLIYNQKEELQARFLGGSSGSNSSSGLNLSPTLLTILGVFTSCFVIMIIGVTMLDWWFIEMTAVFLFGAIIIGFIGKVDEKQFVEHFIKGAGDLLGVAFIIGIARGVSIIMSEGLISDTLLSYASELTTGMNKGLFINTMLFIFGGLSFFIPSTSGLAVLSMPIISPLADTVGIGREMIVNAYQFAVGLFYLLSPTGLVLAMLAVVKIGFNKWLKFVLPLFGILLIITMLALTISVYLGRF